MPRIITYSTDFILEFDYATIKYSRILILNREAFLAAIPDITKKENRSFVMFPGVLDCDQIFDFLLMFLITEP
jgi:hypothetical protein